MKFTKFKFFNMPIDRENPIAVFDAMGDVVKDPEELVKQYLLEIEQLEEKIEKHKEYFNKVKRKLQEGDTLYHSSDMERADFEIKYKTKKLEELQKKLEEAKQDVPNRQGRKQEAEDLLQERMGRVDDKRGTIENEQGVDRSDIENSLDSSDVESVDDEQKIERENFETHVEKELEKMLSNVWIGSYTADKQYDGGAGEDLFDDAENMDEVIQEAKSTIAQAYKEKWPKDKLVIELSKIEVIMDGNRWKTGAYDDLHLSERIVGVHPLGDFAYVSVEALVDGYRGDEE